MAINDTAATYIGISNENEFYSHHYLSEVFKGDIKQVLDGWHQRKDEEDSFETPYQRLKGLARDYFIMRERMRRGLSNRERIIMQREFFSQLLPAIGFSWHPHQITMDDGFELPVLATAGVHEHSPDLLILGAFDLSGDDLDPLSVYPHKEQFHGSLPVDADWTSDDWNHLITNRIYGQSHPPRWVLLLSDSQLLLIDRLKWNQNRLLRFDWDDILGRKDDGTLKATAVLLHKESLLPDEGTSLLDSLDENAHKHAFSVSEDLKYTLREAIELLGNEASDYLIAEAKEKRQGIFTGSRALDAEHLSLECLRYMYRLLFLFYIEARPDLNYVPLTSDAYRKGYSLESLRDLEIVRLTTEESRSGTFIHQSIQRLFSLIYKGYQGVDEQSVGSNLLGEAIHNSFAIDRLDSHLFDPKGTPNLNKVVFRNDTLQRVIELMSLTRPSGRSKRRGRISYAQLGINQLGAVYEALLSYRGFFADRDLYEVKKAGTNPDELETGYFVPAEDLDLYTEDERVFDKDEHGHQKLRMYAKGTFIYRLAGRDRQKSASYYTPEVLTKTLVKYALKELLKEPSDPEAKTADEILRLTICEPAMGSAAFLNEAVNQLSEAYLERKQIELGQRIPHDEYTAILQRVKMYIADRNTFGVDLNPVAVELAEISLWLNAIHGGKQVPWFGYQLFNGNSLIGARRQVYDISLLKKRTKGDAWYNHEPLRLDPFTMATDEGRKESQVYHFLLPDPGMANYNDKVAKSLEPERFAAIKKWRTEFCKPFSPDDMDTLQFLSDKIDELWAEHAKQLKDHRDKTEDNIPVWPQADDATGRRTTTTEKDVVRATGIFNLNAKTASAYRRLKMAMDYWCSLWFWPIHESDKLPSRDEFLMEMMLLLSGDVLDISPKQGALLLDAESEQPTECQKSQKESIPIQKQASLILEDQPELGLTIQQKVVQSEVKDSKGQLRIEKLFEHFPRLQLVHELTERHRFFHWELTFADVFANNGGFDLILGNPPWLDIKWEESGVLADFNPLFDLRSYSANDRRDERRKSFNKYPKLRSAWFAELEVSEGVRNFIGSISNYPLLVGHKVNLYKAFVPLSWQIGNNQSLIGLIHQEGFYDAKRGESARQRIYKRLVYHFQFFNELKLFNDIHHSTPFSINIYKPKPKEINFINISNLFSVKALDECFSSDGELEGVKDGSGKWSEKGNKDRKIIVSNNTLKLYHQIFDSESTTDLGTRLPNIHAQPLVAILMKLSSYQYKLESNENNILINQLFDENAYQASKLIVKDPGEREDELTVYSGPNIYIANPYYKVPKLPYNKSSDYHVVDLTSLPQDGIKRTIFKVENECDLLATVPYLPWDAYCKFTNTYRVAFSEWVNSGSERTLAPCLLPKHVAHVDTIVSVAFKDNRKAIGFLSLALSIPVDFLVKSTGVSHIKSWLVEKLPYAEPNNILHRYLASRALSLTCLSSEYSEFWIECWQSEYVHDSWSSKNKCLNDQFFISRGENWKYCFGLRTDFERRQALLEIDVLSAMILGLSLDDLLVIYKIQFHVMRKYESDTWYDSNGRIIFTNNSQGLTGVGLPRKANKKDGPSILRHPDGSEEQHPLGWEDIRDLPAGYEIVRTIMDDTLPGGPREKQITYVAPFDRCNREDDYRQAWAVFDERVVNE